MFRHFTLAIFRFSFISQPEDGRCKVPKHVGVLYTLQSSLSINTTGMTNLVKVTLNCIPLHSKQFGGHGLLQPHTEDKPII